MNQDPLYNSHFAFKLNRTPSFGDQSDECLFDLLDRNDSSDNEYKDDFEHI